MRPPCRFAAAVACAAALLAGCNRPVVSPKKAYRTVTLAQIRLAASAVELFRASVGRYPTTAEGLDVLVRPPASREDARVWAGPYLGGGKLPEDAWNRPLRYERLASGADKFRIWSAGADGEDGTKDDVTFSSGRQ